MQELEANYKSMNGSKSTKKVKPRNPMPNLIKKKPEKGAPYVRKFINTGGIKFDKLTFGTLRRYQYFFGLDKRTDRPFIEDMDRLIESVEEHFSNELQVDPKDVIFQFLSTKKDPDQDKEYFLRGPKTRMRTPQNQ